jgi:site-specific DNA-methyltransferase (adenine-specific)
LNIIQKAVSELREYENNPRNNDGAVQAVAESIEQFGFKVPIIIDSSGVIIAGHTRKKAAERLGLASVPCVVADDLTPEQIKAFRIADNKTGELAEWDFDLLERELAELTAFDVDMSLFGFDESLFDSFNIDTALEADEEFDVEKELAEIDEPITREGDIWLLGNHRLICGDSTKTETIKKLMDGKEADLLLTDPPYNVAYEGGTQDKLTIQNDNMSDTAFYEFLKDAFSTADTVMREGAGFYIWHADSEGLNFRKACKYAGWKVRQCLIWAKNSIVMGRQDYQWKHEPCLYGWKGGAAHYFIDDRTQSTVLEYNKPLRNGEHPTMKPLSMISRLVHNSSKRGDVVLDTFGGSGTTFVACDELDRICYMCELDPKYCDVIIKRWETLTGDKAVRI